MVSLLLHGALLLLQFGVPNLGMSGAAPPLTVRIAAAPVLSDGSVGAVASRRHHALATAAARARVWNAAGQSGGRSDTGTGAAAQGQAHRQERQSAQGAPHQSADTGTQHRGRASPRHHPGCDGQRIRRAVGASGRS
ncbi:hypothetical protein LP419_03080 [Massilia sp. H-1]|nr:hypothetical protein LP419_03080 [Massilia sp. H-1]